MKMDSVRHCCCGCTLRAGTQILFWLGAIGSGYNIFSAIASSVQQNEPFSSVQVKILINTITLAIFIMGIYGVIKEKSSYLKPYLACHVVFLTTLIIFMIGLPIFGTKLWSYLQHNRDVSINEAVIIIVFTEMACLYILGFTFYFFAVVLNCYKELKGKGIEKILNSKVIRSPFVLI